MRWRFALLLMLLPTWLAAQSYPALHDVTGVASDDVLNLRAAPSAEASIIGELAHDRRDVEIISTDDSGRWGQVNVGEGTGWAALRYLEPQPQGDYVLTRNLTCFGTEPFWNLSIVQGATASLSTPDGDGPAMSVGLLQRAAGRLDRFSLHGDGLVAAIRRQACDDGMTDRAYGLDVDLIHGTPDGPQHLTGCCSLVGG